MANITKRVLKSGEVRYLFRVSLGYDESGKQIVKSTCYSPEAKKKAKIEKEVNRAAILFEEQAKRDYEEQQRIKEEQRLNGITSKKFRDVADEYLSVSENTGDWKISTAIRVKSCRERVYAALGDMNVDEINYRTIQRFIIELSKDGVNQKNGKGLAKKTQKHYISFISCVMRYAITCGIIKSNPCSEIKPTKGAENENDIYSLEEFQALLSALEAKAPTDYLLAFMFMAFLGMRRGEVMGLEYKDFDFDNQTVTISRTSNYRNKETGIYTSSPKTKTSCRTLSVPPDILQLVKRLRAEQIEQMFKCGDNWHDTDRLFITWCGEPMHPNTPYTWLERFCHANDLPFKGLHSFRHFFATLAITSGTDYKTVSTLLGHSQTSTTLNIYAHSVNAVNTQAIESISDTIRGKRKTKKTA